MSEREIEEFSRGAGFIIFYPIVYLIISYVLHRGVKG